VGIDPKSKKILIVKSTQHFYDRFSKIAAQVVYVSAPGAVAPTFKTIDYKVASLDRWPMTENPTGQSK
jgi:microcystin degradation protein MlrC